MTPLKIGQPVFLKPMNNASRRGDGKIIETTITKIGRKYFSVKEKWYGDFEILSMYQRTDSSPNYKAFLDLQEIKDKDMADSLYNKIRTDFFSSFGSSIIPLSSLREIEKIIYKK
jgi:hypothetical protein